MIVRILRDHLAFGVTFHVELAPLHIKEGVGNLESHFRIVIRKHKILKSQLPLLPLKLTYC